MTAEVNTLYVLGVWRTTACLGSLLYKLCLKIMPQRLIHLG